MRRVAAVLVLCLAAMHYAAQACTVGAHIGSWHDRPGFNNTNPGLYVRLDNGVTAGVYRNSLSKPSVYLGRSFETPLADWVSVAVTVGVVSGYNNPILVAPSIVFGSSVRTRIVGVLPAQRGDTAGVHLSLEISV